MFENIDAALRGNINYKKTYSQNGRDLYQTEIDTHFQYANNYYEIEMESANGSNNFSTIGVRIDRATNMNTGMKLSDDHKKLIFQKDMGIVLGRKFSFAENTWLVTDNSTLLTNSSSCIVRRCNNVIRYKEGSNYDSEPCVIDYTSSSNSLDVKTDIILPDKNIKVYVQYNDVTKQIQINQRFIFGSQVFKVISFEDYNRLKTLDKSVGLMSIIMELDAISPLDDFVNDIATEGLVISAQESQTEISTLNEADATEENTQILNINPFVTEIREGKTQEYQIIYNNENVTNLTNYSISGEAPNSSYRVVRGDNSLLVTCVHKVYGNPLQLDFTYGDKTASIKIYLRGLF